MDYCIWELETALTSSSLYTTWINFYYREPRIQLQSDFSSLYQAAASSLFGTSTSVCLPWDETPFELIEPTSYAGRLLISILAKRTDVPAPLAMAPSGSCVSPAITVAKIKANIHELSSIIGHVGPIRVSS